MAGIRSIVSHTFLLGMVALGTGCVIHDHGDRGVRDDGYREGYYDHEHNRYYHEKEWHECREHDSYCH